jgi:hypothetical protein
MLKTDNMEDKHDVVIPLGNKSYENNNFEIKVAVASIKKYFKCLNRIIIVTQIPKIQALGDDIVWVSGNDIYSHDKDANIIHKVRTAIENVPDLTDNFIMWSDDQFITKDTEWSDTTPRYMKIYNEDTKAYFDNMAKKRVWWRRLKKCFERFPNNGMGCRFFNPHIPSPMNKHKFMEMCQKFPYQKEEGITIYDLYYNFVGEKGVPNFDEYHCSCGETNWKGCRWVGYYNSSMRNRSFVSKLKEMFKV